MNPDIEIVNWLNKQFDEDGDLKSITFEMCNYIDEEIGDGVKSEKSHNLLKAVRQDLQKIHLIVDKMNFFHKQSLSNSQDEFFRDSIGFSSIPTYLGMDIEYFFVKYRSIIDYSIDLLVEFYPELKKKRYKLEDKMNYLHDVFKENEFITKMILSTKWFYQFKEIRNSIVHNGASCLIFNESGNREILFQIYNTELTELLVDNDYYKYNQNVYFFRRIYVVYMAYLLFYLETLFRSIIAKKKGIQFSKVEEKYSTNLPEIPIPGFKITHIPNQSAKVLLDWTLDYLNNLDFKDKSFLSDNN
ncbi:hypothetical protein EC604_06565 [Paenibacillus amylolyticus]|uniref:Cthe-2314-like HEPN domain-containing protein n=1 Tax=Paenibacillus amylolyticus TaxID=1451 RepID=A0A5M9WPG2_PAEAM|nr:hypothetical protein [Paenibacillus amylolyticus]KAA8783506.1 hypothetical protein EC604_06565 [Paenibacillus amylolyticus]